MSSHARNRPFVPRITTSPNGHYRWDGAKWVLIRGRRIGLPWSVVAVLVLLVLALVLVLASSVAIVGQRGTQEQLQPSLSRFW